MKLFTIGYSTHTVHAFIRLLKVHGVTAIADVRSSPKSRFSPSFNREAIRQSLAAAGIAYVFLGSELGARPLDAACYDSEGRARYELIAKSESFLNGLTRIQRGLERYVIALMCAEYSPLVCHRAVLVCQFLRQHPIEIGHILRDGSVQAHSDFELELLRLHKLFDGNEGVRQIELFSDDLNFDCDVVQGDVISKAYQLQGEKIAYQKRV